MSNPGTVNIPAGTIAYRESGIPELPVALYVHGVIVNSYLWRHQLAAFADIRHNIAIDLLGHGYSVPAPGQGLTFTDQAEAIDQFLIELGIGQVDLVASDSGTGIAQIFAATHPDKVRSLVVTNGDVNDNWPPTEFAGFTERVADGDLPAIIQEFHDNPDSYRSPAGIGGAYQSPEEVTDEEVAAYIDPYIQNPAQVDALAGFINSFDNVHTTRIADKLATLETPAKIIWGTGDIFFDLTGARWLHDTLPNAYEITVLEGGALLLPSERADEVNTAIADFWERVSFEKETRAV